MSDFKDFMKSVLEGKVTDLSGLFDEDEKYTPVGEIPKELLQRYKRYMKDHNHLDHEIRLFIEQEQLKLRRIVDELYEGKLESMNELRSSLWDEISDAVGVSRAEDLTIDRETGIVSKKISSNEKKKSHLTVVSTRKDNKDLH
ncbi:hypothetical protein BSK59_16285 [Paenibacillus odorifer]|uniref:hypothetical protein n=1 Tax=Paenibacillus odorifer TaxID=189426 RepID=UPI00096F9C62|nr:hypothetical protein [Paenibacillus odorifer]OME54137.1 hypothetical protein BSK59_16285 [Paenibacillus odorifer]